MKHYADRLAAVSTVTALLTVLITSCVSKPPQPIETQKPLKTREHAVVPKKVTPKLAETRRVIGTPQPEKFQQILGAASSDRLNEDFDRPNEFAHEQRPPNLGPDDFFGHYRRDAKTSFIGGSVTFSGFVEGLLTQLPDDAAMATEYPDLVRPPDMQGQDWLKGRIDREKNVTVDGWIYWVKKEDYDRDYHIIVGNTSELTDQTVFMNTEVSALPTDPTSASDIAHFKKERQAIEKILQDNKHANNAFKEPVPVRITGTLLWDGEHPSPNNVGPADYKPNVAWEIHPISSIGTR